MHEIIDKGLEWKERAEAAEAANATLREALTGIVHSLAGKPIGYYGNYTAKELVIDSEHEKRLLALLNPEKETTELE